VYARAQRALGLSCWLLGVSDSGTLNAAALGVVKSGRIRRTLDLPSSPVVAKESPFWSGLERLCRDLHVTDLEVSTFATCAADIPTLRGEIRRVRRTEFELSLANGDLIAGLSQHHRVRVKKARKNGTTMRVSAAVDALDEHVRLRAHSMERRRARGESVPLDLDRRGEAALLASGAGELFQAVLHGHVASSLLVIKSTRGAYFKSAGSSIEGMRVGASHFLVLEAAVALQSEGIETFFLGGARPHEEGLRAYKLGFGSRPIETEAVTAYVGGRFRRRISEAVESIQRAVTPRSVAAVNSGSGTGV
jgi:hypothetical protein